ncbi:uncharacterized protein I206_103293 [Kwoniella pini CBS 10737]|uniref:Uncharacterized protein n=1 Tax=Kwoniella pini CBS 10737 TaxID=1296096 RepID=A0A1B9I9W9_9TREE|nr:uncharacterized protein I206_01701 [Kwoniella pini CBS 10737]OCF52412.1 hypothetical protein I206_01701 [Kwoniella pini CBS 10737]
MEVDGDRITDDERMDEDLEHQNEVTGLEEDYPVGEGEGVMEDSDGDEMMADEIQDDEEYEVAMDEENIEPIIKPDTGGEDNQVEIEPAPIIENPSIPFNTGSISTSASDSSTPKPLVSPFPEMASNSTNTVLPKPLESPGAPETDMTPVEEQDEQPFIDDIDNGNDEYSEKRVENGDPFESTELSSSIEARVPSPEPQKVATSEEALDVLSSHPQATSNMIEAKAVPTVPGPQSSTLQVGESSKRAKSREPTPDLNGGPDDGQEEILDEDEDAEGEEEEDYEIDANSLPPIIIHLPNDQARYLFEAYENDPDALPIWMKDRQAELAEASLSDILNAIKLECNKEGLSKNGALIICEKQMDLKMNEDDVNLQSITFLELILLHHGCGLPEPVQLYLSWEEPRFITRFNAIQAELDAVRERSESADLKHDDAQQREAEIIEKNADEVQEKRPEQPDQIAKDVREDKQEGEQDGEYEEYEDDEYVEEEEAKSQHGAYSNVGEREYRDKAGRRVSRDAEAQYAESVDYEVNTRDLERAHPNWAAVRQKPTDALHFEGPSGARYLNYAGEGRHQPESDEQGVEVKELDDQVQEEEEEYDVEEREDEEELQQRGRWNDDGGDTVEGSLAESKDTDTQDQDRANMNDATVPEPLRVPLDELAKLEQNRANEISSELQKPRHAGLGEKRAADSTVDSSALPTPYDSVPPSQAEAITRDTIPGLTETAADVPYDEIALKREREASSAIPTPAMSSLTPSEQEGALQVAERVGEERINAIPEDGEEFEDFVDRVNEDKEAGELEIPGGGNAMPITPAISSLDDGYVNEASYDDDDDDDDDDDSILHDTQLGKGRDTVPVTPLDYEAVKADEGDYFDDTLGSEDDVTLPDEDDPTYDPGLESTEYTVDPTKTTETQQDTTSISGMPSPHSAKHFMDNDEENSDFDTDSSKRPRTDTTD